MQDQSNIQKAEETLARRLATRSNFLSVLAEAGQETLHRFRAVACFTAPMHAVLAWLFAVYTPPAARPELAQWAALQMEANLYGCFCVLLAGLLTHRALRRQHQKVISNLVLQITIGFLYLYLGIYLSLNDLVFDAGSGLSTYVTVCIMFGVMTLAPPTIAIPFFALISLLFYFLLGQATVDPTLLPTLYLYAVLGPALAAIACWLNWDQYAQSILLRRQLSRSNETLMRQQQELSFLADHDALTGLYNRREFVRIARMELLKAARVPCATALIMVDLDHFKKINDRYGHPGGDAVLKAVTAVLTHALRDTDTLARLGGEEFIVLLPATGQEGALQVAAKLRDAVRDNNTEFDGGVISVTASLGVCSLHAGQQGTWEALYAAADHALYQAKHLGRDRVEYAPLEDLASRP